jgi:hypothetical protein
MEAAFNGGLFILPANVDRVITLRRSNTLACGAKRTRIAKTALFPRRKFCNLKSKQSGLPSQNARNGILPKVPKRATVRDCAAASESPEDAQDHLRVLSLQSDLDLCPRGRNRLVVCIRTRFCRCLENRKFC